MKRASIVMVVFMFLGVTLGVALAADKSKVYYVCNCGQDCKCDTISKEPGKCKCGKDLVAMHLLDIEKDKAVFCQCGGECTCERSKDDPSKCGCGKPVKMVSLKGYYVCACGPDCKCGAISDKPGKCGCGKEMKQVI